MSKSFGGWKPGCLVGVLLCAAAVHAATVSVDTGTGKGAVSKTWNVALEEGTDGKALFRAEDVQWLEETGSPRLPWGTLTVLLPPDADAASVKCDIESIKYEPVDGTWQVDPQPLRATRDKDGNEIVLPPAGVNLVNGRDTAIYGANAFWPAEQARVLSTGKMRKWKLAEIGVPLVIYNPVTGALSKLGEASIRVSYSRVAFTARQQAETGRSDPAGLSRLKSAALNFDTDAAAYGDTIPTGEGGTTPLGPSSNGYCILTTAAIQSASTKLAAFVTHKQSKGFNVQLITESTWGGTGLTGNAAADKIRTWLQANYLSSNIKYVLLIGDPNQTSAVPMKLCWTGEGGPTDYYYSDLSGNWDLNGNGVYGEDADVGAGGIDRYWEVVVGRIPYYGVMTDLDAILQKTMDYENAADKSWRRRVLLPEVPLDGVTPSFQLGEEIKNNILAPAALPFYRIYNEPFTASPPPEMTPNSTPGTTAVWKRTPYGMVIWCTHGWSGGASAVMDNGWSPLLNNAYPSLTYHGSCSNSYPEDTNNIAYAMLKNGGINSVGGTRMTWYWVGESSFTNTGSIGGLGYGYTYQLVTQNKAAGEALANAFQTLPAHGWSNYLLMNMYGDPSLQILPPAPTELAVCPTDVFYAMGTMGGPFPWSSRTYTLKNPFTSAISWTATKTAGWLQISPTSGSIAAGGSVDVTVSLATAATTQAEGLYTDVVTFTDTTHSKSVTRNATLEVQPKQMIADWKLDETSGTAAADSSGVCQQAAGLNGGLDFAVNSVTGKFGTALNFDGVDDYLSLPNLRMTTNCMTFTAWIKRNGTQPPYAGIMFNRSNSMCMGLHFTSSTSNRLRYTWAGQYSDWSSGLAPPDGQWALVALVVRPDSATVYMYDTSLHSAVHTGAHPLQYFGGGTCIGLDPVQEGDPAAYHRWFKGAIDDVRFYNYALDDAAITALATSGGKAQNPRPVQGCQTVPVISNLYWTPSPGATAHDVYFGTNATAVLNATTASAEYKGRQTNVGYDPVETTGTTYYWRVDEVVGTQVIKGDVWWFTTSTSSIEPGLRFHGTMNTADISGTTLINTAGLPQYNGSIIGSPVMTTGISGQAMTFDGVNDRVQIPALNLNADTVTITAWINRNGAQANWAGLVYSRAGSTSAGLNLGAANDLRYNWNDDGSAWDRSSGLIVPDGQWVFTALVVQPDRATVYLGAGGAVSSWVNWNFHDVEEFNGVTNIGWDSIDNSRRFKGLIDDVGIWNRALSPAEIQGMYDAGAAGTSFGNLILTNSPTVTVSEGGTATFQVKLGSLPSGNVTVSVARDSGSEHITVQSGASLVFTPSTWNTYQTVTLASSRDVDAHDDVATIRCSSSGLVDAAVTAIQSDNTAGDFSGDGDVDMEDFAHLQLCLTGTGVPVSAPECQDADLDGNMWVDQADINLFIDSFNGPNKPPKSH